MSRFLVVTGTDTGVGKTCVAAGLARALGSGVRAIKLMESGCANTDAASDGTRLAQSTGQEEPLRALLELAAPLAPPVAADREGLPIPLQSLIQTIRNFRDEYVIVEGAGGLLAPLTWEENILDVIAALNARVLVVGSDRLGTINHTLLTLAALKDCDVIGVVLSAPAESDPSTGTNAATLQAVVGRTRIHVLPRVQSVDEAASHLAPVLGWL